MQSFLTDEKYKIIASEIYKIHNIQVLLEQSLSLIELNCEYEIEPQLMLVKQQKKHIKTILRLI